MQNLLYLVSDMEIEQTENAETLLAEVRQELYNFEIPLIARRYGISSSTLYRFRSGRVKWPRADTLFIILRITGFQIKIERRGIGVA